MLADRYGRRIPLMANVIYFSIIELFSGFSQTYTQFLVLRVLFGIGLEANGVLVRRLRWSRRRANGEECCRASSRADIRSAICSRQLLHAPCCRTRLALDVLARCIAGASRAVHPHEGAGIRGLARASRRYSCRNVLSLFS